MRRKNATRQSGFFFVHTSVQATFAINYIHLGYLLAIFRAILIIIIMTFMVLAYLLTTVFIKNTDERAFWLRRTFCKICLVILNMKYEIEGQPASTPALYVCNHRSFSDPVLLSKYLNAFVVAKAEVANMPVINKGASITGIIYVKRENSDSRKATRQALVDNLKKGRNILVYPEGTTNDQKYVMPYKHGTFNEAANNNFPIVPITMEYRHARDIWKDRGMISQFFRQCSKWRTDIKLKIGTAQTWENGESGRINAMSWTNQTIYDMHSGWESVFDDTLKPPTLSQT